MEKTTIGNIKIEISKVGVTITTIDEICFVPKAHISGVVYQPKSQKLEIYNVNKEMTNSMTGVKDAKKIYDKILGIL